MNQKRNLSDREIEELLDRLDGITSHKNASSGGNEEAKLLLAAGESLSHSIDTEQAWKAFKKKHKRSRKRLFYIAGSIAASALLCFIVGKTRLNDTAQPQMVALYERTDRPAYIRIVYNNHIQEIGLQDSILNFHTKDYPLSIATPAGRKITVILPDSSRVQLNADSRLSYRKTVRQRTVSLEGEAFFDVTHDAAHPFTIQSGNVVSQVLGTAFNIKSYQNEQPHISLLRGSLKITSPRQEKIIVPGDEAKVKDNGKIDVQKINTTDMAAWTKDEFLFDQMSVAEIVKEIGRYYNLNVRTQIPHLTEEQYIHLRCSRQTDIETIIQMLNDICSIHIQKQGNTLIIH